MSVTFGLGLLGVWIAQGDDEWFRAVFAVRRWLSGPWERKFARKIQTELNTLCNQYSYLYEEPVF